MRQRFFTSTAQGRLIKNILCNTPIPIYDTVRPGDYIIRSNKYIYNNTLIQCTKSGLLEEDAIFIALDYTFYWGVDKLNHTERLKSNTSYYDSDTHQWLGRYLRAYKDMKGVNLMPFYNCFTGVYTSRFKLQKDEYTNTFSTDSNISVIKGNYVSVYQSDFSYDTYSQGSQEFNDRYVEASPYKILQVPIKLNKTYTIAIDCDANVKIAPAFINHGKLVNVTIGTEEISLTDVLIKNMDSNGNCYPISIEKTNTSFIKPFTYTVKSKNKNTIHDIVVKEDVGLTYEQLLQRYERYLYLLIQLPRDNTSSTVILEGDYTEASVDKVFSEENINMVEPDYEDLHTATSTIGVSKSIVDSSNMQSQAPYVSYASIPGLQFSTVGNKHKLKSDIQSIHLDGNFGYLEYDFMDSIPIAFPYGDVNFDGVVTEEDYTYVSNYVAEVSGYTLNENQILVADIDGNGVVTRPDATKIARIANGTLESPGNVVLQSDYNLMIFSYIPIEVGTSITVTWYDVNEYENVIEEDIRYDEAFMDEMCISKLSLLQFSDCKNYTFADTLMEYLLLNAIDSAEEIGDNIKRIQNDLAISHNKYFTYGAWDAPLRRAVFSIGNTTKTIPHIDNIGYVNKDIEIAVKQKYKGAY